MAKTAGREAQGKFLDQLAGSANIVAAAEAAALSVEQIWKLRRSDSRFAGEWREAMEAALDMVEMRLIGRVLAGRAVKGGAVDVELALRVLGQYRFGTKAPAKAKPSAPARATREETDKAILKKLTALERQRQTKEAGAGAA